jgi:hypothetical protein
VQGAAGSATAWREVDHVERLVYNRRQAAEALGMSVTTLDRRVVPAIETVKLPWGARVIPVRELQRLLADHIEEPRRTSPAGCPGRPRTVPDDVVARIAHERAAGRSFRAIADALTAAGVPTGQGAARWWPSTVRDLLARRDPGHPS